MLHDIQEVDAGSVIDCDVAIVGAGAAGITLAKTLADKGLEVGLFEGGGLKGPGEAGRELYEGEVGFKPYSLTGSRLRYFGGTTNHWGGWCRPLDRVDFEQKPHVPLSGWPIARDDLDPYYRRAHEVCEIPETTYDPDVVLRGYRDRVLNFDDSSGFTTKFFRFSPPTRFGKAYREAIASSDKIKGVLHANLVVLERDGKQVTGLRLRSLEGREIRARAGRYVLALGGIENARMLLQSADGMDNGLGNDGDWVGRCFMDHFGFRPGYVLTRAKLKYHRFTGPAGEIMPLISMTRAALNERGLNNFSVHLNPQSPDDLIGPEFMDTPGLMTAGDAGAWRYAPQFIGEPTPNPDSRVTLTGERDALGLPKVRLDWRINERDFDSLVQVTKALAETLGHKRLGRLRQIRWNTPQVRYKATPSMHHIGTTRMSKEPGSGVVDADCRVHGTPNLYVAGSSVFPTAGFSNPTLTIVALTLRLAEHLSEAIRRPAA